MRPRFLSAAGRPCFLALAVALAYLVPALLVLDDYGPTYDAIKGDYPYGERLLGYLETGDERFLDLRALRPVPEQRAPHPNFDLGRFRNGWVFPVGALLSAVSCRWLWTEWGLFPALSAHFLASVLVAAVLVFVVTAFACARWGRLAGVVAGATLFLTPSFFGHSFNNPKDVPECCFYTSAVLVGYLALERGDRRLWLAGGALTGLALAQKANALFLPVQLGLFLAGVHLGARRRRESAPRLGARDLLLAAGGFLAAYYAVSPAFWSAPIAGPRLWLGQMMKVGNFALSPGGLGGEARVSFAAPLAVLTTTPLVALGLAALGLLRRDLAFRLRWFLVVSLVVPIGRNLLPGMRSFEGTRHFLEFLPILALAAGAGAAWLAERARSVLPRLGTPLASSVVGLLALGSPAWAVLSTHPNQVLFTNVLAAEPLADAWGNSYWQGLAWLGAHAEPDARLFVPMVGFIALSGAPVRLRADIQLSVTSPGGEGGLPIHVMHRPDDLDPFHQSLERSPLLHEVRVQGHPILHLHRLEHDAAGLAALEAWDRLVRRQAVKKEVTSYLRKTPGLLATVLELRRQRLGAQESYARLRALLPVELCEKLVEAELLPSDLLAEPEPGEE